MPNRRQARILTAGVTLLMLSLSGALGAPGKGAAARGKEARMRTGPIVGRLMQDRGASIGRAGQRLGVAPEEIELYSRLAAIDTGAVPPTIRVWIKASEEGQARLEAAGFRLQSRAGDLVSAIVPIPSLAGMRSLPGIEWVQASGRMEMELDVSVANVRADPTWVDHDTYGEGVIVGIIDSGVDWSHPDFQTPAGTTRFLSFWDQTGSCGSPPPGFGYGCYYTQADITASLGSPPGNNDGHGTHVTGIASGNGLASPAGVYQGMAPKADLIGVKIFPDIGAPSCASCDGGDGLVFLTNEAASLGKPLSVNMSFGQSFTTAGRDGSDPLEILIDSTTGSGIPGVVVSKSAGNNRGAPLHVEGTVTSGATTVFTFTIPSYTAAPGTFNDIQVFSLYYDPGDILTVTVRGPLGNSHSATTGDGFTGVGTGEGVIIIDDSVSPTVLGDPWFYIEVDDQLGIVPRAGQWRVEIHGDSVSGTGNLDMWIALSTYGVSQLFAPWDNPDFNKLTSVPATANNVTAVGAHVTKVSWVNDGGSTISYTPAPPLGEIGDFSSPGPSRKGVLKPEISAPGMGIGSALSADGVPFADPLRILPGGNRWILEGTSMSSPHMAGGYARLLEVNPGLDALQLRRFVMDAARTDAFTGAVPNNDWGAGKLNLDQALRDVIKDIPDLEAQVDTVTFRSAAGWTGATSYNAYRADASTLTSTFFGTCFQTGLVNPEFTDASVPPPGGAYAYVLTAVQNGIEGQAGFLTKDPDPSSVVSLVPNKDTRSNANLTCAP